jgi:hypothetical protein
VPVTARRTQKADAALMVRSARWSGFAQSAWSCAGEAGIGFAYAMNRTGFHLWDDPREVALGDALYRTVLGEMPQRPD